MTTHRTSLSAAAAVLATALLAAACTIDPVVVPSPEPTPSRSPSATASPSPSPSASATPSPTPSPSPSATPTEAPPVGESLFTDDFGDATSPLWGTGTNASGSVAYAAGALRIEPSADRSSLWSWRAFAVEQTFSLVHVEGTVATSGSGAAGWLCGIGDDRFVGGLIDSSGEWVVVDITAAQSSALERGPLPEGIDPAVPHRLTVQCSGTDAGPQQIRLLVDGQEAASFEGTGGIGAFDRVGAYAFADVAGYSAAFDDATVFGADAVTEPAPGSLSPSPAP